MNSFSSQFQGVINTHFGQKILDFLNEEKTIVMLETATYLDRPALEALVPTLEARFGDELQGIKDNSNNLENIDFDRLKQTIGHMVIVADWPEDFSLFLTTLILQQGVCMMTPKLTMELWESDTSLTIDSKIPHNALQDAFALKRRYFI